MLRKVILFLFLLFSCAKIRAQSVAAARKFFIACEEPARRECQKLALIHNRYFDTKNGLSPSALSDFRKHLQKNHLDKPVEIPGDYRKLQAAYSAFFQAMDQHAERMESLIKSLPDSSVQAGEGMLQSASQLKSKSAELEKEVIGFCILFRLDHPEDKTALSKLMKEELLRLSYVNGIRSCIHVIEEMEKACLRGFLPDSGHSAAGRRIALIDQIELQKVKLKSISTCCGDRNLKAAAENSLRLFSLEARNSLPALEKFRESELVFIRIHRQMKTKKSAGKEDQASYRLAVKKYNEDIRSANELVRKLENERDVHMIIFREALNNFLKDSLKDVLE